MKLGIITYQNAKNYGAAFQCYALFQYVSECGNFDTEIINYKNEYITKKSSINYIVKSNISFRKKIMRILGAPLQKTRARKFNNFILQTHLSKPYDREHILKIEEEYDRFIIGSDQVWNYKLNANDTTYYLDMIKDRKKIMTYASSIGLDDIKEECQDWIRQYLKDIYSISVREFEAATIIKDITGREPHIDVDPVFLLGREKWLSLTKPSARNDNIFFHFFESSNRKLADRLVGDKPFILRISGGIKPKDYLDWSHSRVCQNFGPVDYLNALVNSKFAYTDSFHCTAMCIILHVPFITFLRDSGNTRLTNLLKNVGLEDRIYSAENRECLSPIINWDEVDLKVQRLSSRSKKYLQGTLEALEQSI